jgi:methylglutaconyl-CoA hydratase
VVLASEEAFFSIPEVRIGMAPLILAPFFIRAMGYRRFRRYGISGERFDAVEALRIGLAHQICPAGNLEKAAAEIIDALLHGAPGALRELKRVGAAMATPLLPDVSANSAKHEFGRSPEAIEGIASFREKRKPSWYPASQ